MIELNTLVYITIPSARVTGIFFVKVVYIKVLKILNDKKNNISLNRYVYLIIFVHTVRFKIFP